MTSETFEIDVPLIFSDILIDLGYLALADRNNPEAIGAAASLWIEAKCNLHKALKGKS